VNIRKVSVFAIFAAASVVPSAAFAATATTLPAKAVTPVATKAAPVAAVPAVTKAAPIAAAPVATAPPIAAAKSKTLTKTAAPAAVVVAGNFCKKVLVGQSSHDKLGTVLNCVADAKGQPRWTK
jgi:hypothetical protein